MNFADLIAPVPPAHFLAEMYDRKPLHIPAEGDAGEARRGLLPWARLNALLGVAGQWGEENVQMILDRNPLPPELYLADVATRAGMRRRGDPAKIESLLAIGASLVADAVEDASPELKQVTSLLSAQFLGTAGANAYCSFKGLQAFQTHCDLHDVFAVHCEGEKVWRIYANRAPDPVEQPQHDEIERTKGPVLMEVGMRPGDLLYIPRGYYHDALASSEASLHVTFSVARHTGRVMFRILEELAMRDPAFRAYLPDGRADAGKPLAERIDTLATRAAELMRTPAFAQALLARQLDLAKPFRTLQLPQRPQPAMFVSTQRPWRIDLDDSGATLRWQGGETQLGVMADPASWFLNQGSTSFEQLAAHYPQFGEAALVRLAQLLERAGLCAPHRG